MEKVKAMTIEKKNGRKYETENTITDMTWATANYAEALEAKFLRKVPNMRIEYDYYRNVVTVYHGNGYRTIYELNR